MYNPVGEGFALAEMLFQLSANLAGDEDKRYFLQMYFPSHFKFGMEEIAKSINARMEIDMDLDMDDSGKDEQWTAAIMEFYESAAGRWAELETQWKMEGLKIGEESTVTDKEHIELQKWISGYVRELWAIN